MTKIKRYDCDVKITGMNASTFEYEDKHGPYVLHGDHAAIVTALQEQVRELAAENSQNGHSDLYVAIRTMSDIEALDDKHLTICYMAPSETSKLNVNEIMPSHVTAKVTDIVYWERVNLTVALVDSEESHRAYQMLTSNGFTYGFDFVPHITLCVGNKTHEYMDLISEEIIIGNPYIRVRTSKKETPATDAFLREIRAQAVDDFGVYHNFSEKQSIQCAAKIFSARIRSGEQP